MDDEKGMNETTGAESTTAIGGPTCSVLLGTDGYINFIADITEKSETHINVTVKEVTAWGEDNQPLDADLYCNAYLKWDGCCHVWFGEEDENDKQSGYLHLCGVGSWKNHVAMMEWLYKLAETHIGKFTEAEKWVSA